MFKSLNPLSWADRNSHSGPVTNPAKQKADAAPTGLAALVNDEPPRPDGSDKFFGMENVVGFGNTCYCNSILQCLYYSKPFRESVVNFPYRSDRLSQPNGSASTSSPLGDATNGLVRIISDPLLKKSSATSLTQKTKPQTNAVAKEDAKKKMVMNSALVLGPIGNPNELKDSPEVKKKQALATGPVLNIDQSNSTSYGMDESLFSALKDVFESVVSHQSKTGVVSPNKFLEVLRRQNDMFSGQQHQDAHEFLNYVLNQVIENVDDYQKKNGERSRAGSLATPQKSIASLAPASDASGVRDSSSASSSANRWIHELFEGLLSSETKCLTCENVSRRDEQFLDLSIDLEKNSSVTSCLRNFSASEMLCERNKFHCDTCGGLQEAEKRMKIKRLPKVLALHLKRFKFMEHLGRFEKLHYRVLYPYHLRLFNTTDDADDPDRLYELYAVVVHIGGGPYHGHYVAIVKTEDKGWLLFDDELVEPVDKSYVRNFFGEKPGMACAYVLFYQETTLEAVQKEMWADEQAAAETRRAAEASKTESAKGKSVNGSIGHSHAMNGHALKHTVETSRDENLPPLHVFNSAPVLPSEISQNGSKLLPGAAVNHSPSKTASAIKSKKEKEREDKWRKEREKAEKKAAKGELDVGGASSVGGGAINRFRNTSRSMRNGKWRGSKDKDKNSSPTENGDDEIPPLPPTPTAFPLGTSSNGEKKEEQPVEKSETPEKKDEKKDEKKENHKDKDKEKDKHHRNSLFRLRRKASVAFTGGFIGDS